MELDPTSLRAVLERLELEGLVRLEPRLILRAEQLLAAGCLRDRAELAVALASLCAREPEKWTSVHARALELLRVSASVRAGPRPPRPPPPPPGAPPAPPRWLPVAVSGGILGALGLAWALWPRIDPPSDPTTPVDVTGESSSSTTTGDERQTTGSASTTESTSTPGSTSADPPPPPPPPPPITEPSPFPGPLIWFLGGLGLSFTLLALGLRLALLPLLWRLRLKAERERERATSRGYSVIYRATQYLPFPAEIIDDAGAMLGRVRLRDSAGELDIPRTIDATCRRGGMLTPVEQPGPARREVILLLERGDGLLLGAVDLLLDRWQRGGLLFHRFHFNGQLNNLSLPGTREQTDLATIARRSEGSPLLIIARSSILGDSRGALPWLRDLQPWPLRALLNLEPREELTWKEVGGATPDALERGGLPCFPFTDRGLEALARYFASGGQARMSDRGPALRPVAEVLEALELWAAFLACVPDPTPDQLEEFRQRLGPRHLRGVLDDRRYVVRLVEWLRAEKGVRRPLAPDGRRFELNQNLVFDLHAALKRADAAHDQTSEIEVRELILGQLDRARPEAPFDELRRQLKRAEHWFFVTEKTGKQRPKDVPSLASFSGTSLAPEALQIVSGEVESRRRAGVEVSDEHLALLRRAHGRALRSGELLREVFRGAGALVPTLALAGLGAGAWLALLAVGRVDAGLGLIAGGVGLTSAGGLAWSIVRLARRSVDDELARAAVDADARASEGAARPQVDEELGTRAGDDLLRPQRPPTLPGRWAAALRHSPPVRLGGLDAPPTGEDRGVVHVALAKVAPMEFIGLTGGEFTMGSRDDDPQAYPDERPRHRRHVRAFAIARTPVTQAQYVAVTGKRPSHFEGDDRPVEQVSWEDAVRFCNALSASEGLSCCYHEVEGTWHWDQAADGYRLPTEAEWEYACRAGTTTDFGFVSPGDSLSDYAWFKDNAGDQTHPVGGLKKNPWGLQDMHGNVREWCWNWYGSYSAQISLHDDKPENGGGRVLRGGAFWDVPRNLRSADRDGDRPTDRGKYYGIRCVRAPRLSVAD